MSVAVGSRSQTEVPPRSVEFTWWLTQVALPPCELGERKNVQVVVEV